MRRAVDLGFAFVVGCLIGAALADQTDWIDWLWHWQTMTTGVLAVGAAALTVWQMRLGDERQQLRYDGERVNAAAGDAAKIKRARHLVDVSLPVIAKRARQILTASSGERRSDELRSVTANIAAVASRLESITLSWAMREVRPFFDENAESLFANLQDASHSLAAASEGMREALIRTHDINAAVEFLSVATQYLEWSAAWADEFQEAFAQLANRFEV